MFLQEVKISAVEENPVKLEFFTAPDKSISDISDLFLKLLGQKRCVGWDFYC